MCPHSEDTCFLLEPKFSTGSIRPFPTDGVFVATLPNLSTFDIAHGEGTLDASFRLGA